MNRASLGLAIGYGILSGFLLCFTYIHGLEGYVSLNQIVLQLSGSRGDLLLHYTLTDIVRFNGLLIPHFIFQSLVALRLYQVFCTSSIYIFSRTPNRRTWYGGQCLQVIMSSFLYMGVQLVLCVLISYLRFEIGWTKEGVLLLLFHWVLYSLWSILMALLTSNLALLWDSSRAFFTVFLVQMMGLAAFSLLNTAEQIPQLFKALMVYNPMTRLVLGWQNASLAWMAQALKGPWPFLKLDQTYVGLLILILVVYTWGSYLVTHHEFILADPEFGGI